MKTFLVTLLILLALPLPYAVERAPSLRKTPVTFALVLANLAIFAINNITPHGLTQPFALYDKYAVTPAQLHLYTLITYTFIHVGLGHVMWNMLYLYLFGPIVEERIGSLLYGMLYFLGGAAGGLLNTAMVLHFATVSSATYVPLVGASGAISAVLGLFGAFGGRRLLKMFWPAGTLIGRGWHLLEIPSGLLVWFWLAQSVYGAGMTVLRGDMSGVAYFAHLGGLLFGFGCGILGGLRNEPAFDGTDPTRALDRSSGNSQTSPLTSADVVDLLERSIDERDFPRAAILYTKCRTIGVSVSDTILESLSALAADNGETEQADQLRRLVAQRRMA